MTLQLTIPGRVTSEGYLHVEKRVDLPPGPVNVTIEASQPEATREDIREVLEEIWAARKARGAIARTKEEIDAEIDEMRNEDEVRMQEIENLQAGIAAERRRTP